MDIRIKTTGYEVTPEAQAYLDERIATIEKSLADDALEARLEVEIGRGQGHSKHGEVWSADIHLIIEKRSVHSHATGESINAAIDEVKDEIIRQYRKHKQLHRRFLRRGGKTMKWLMHFGRDN